MFDPVWPANIATDYYYISALVHTHRYQQRCSLWKFTSITFIHAYNSNKSNITRTVKHVIYFKTLLFMNILDTIDIKQEITNRKHSHIVHFRPSPSKLPIRTVTGKMIRIFFKDFSWTDASNLHQLLFITPYKEYIKLSTSCIHSSIILVYFWSRKYFSVRPSPFTRTTPA